MIRIFRLPNLIIVALTQYLLQYFVLIPAMNEAGIPVSLDHFHFFLLVFTTIVIAAGGYLINDLMDYETDLINKPEKVYINKALTKRHATYLYILLFATGCMTAVYLANHVRAPGLALLYPAAVALLYSYARYFKRSPLTGNVVVAFFCAGVAGIVLFSERQALLGLLEQQPAVARKIVFIFAGYILFAFVSTLLREIIKDLEDVEGDQKTGIRTYPVRHGIRAAVRLSMIVAILFMTAMIYGSVWLWRQHELAGLYFGIAGVIAPLFYIFFLLRSAKSKIHFTRLSKWTKFVMLSGLLLLIIIWMF